ncbi:MAG: DUF4892 domain-containing protein [Halieaceae bacterium]|nr:DUF4892 domain-containing protein [Halieaceae bacterium]
MRLVTTLHRRCRRAAMLAVMVFSAAGAQAETAAELLQQLNEFPHAKALDFSESEVRDYEVGLGAMRKVGGAWTFKRSERLDGLLTRYTWQIVDGYTSLEVLDELEATIAERTRGELLFACDGRACGPGVQWANRVFQQRLLYGREELQRYRVYAMGDEPFDLLLVYSGSRTADRQYLHAELLQVTGD